MAESGWCQRRPGVELLARRTHLGMDCSQNAADLPITEQKLCHGYGVLYILAREGNWVV